MSEAGRSIRNFLLLFMMWGGVSDESVAEVSEKVQKSPRAPFQTETVRGRVVWAGDVLKERFDVSVVDEAAQRILVLFTEEGRLEPLVEDLRVRAFRSDERLRGKPMELFVRRYRNHPLLQVLRIYELRGGQKYEVDYWCDVCAIVMFEKGFCACCQDNNRLRHRLVKPAEKQPAEKQPAEKQPAEKQIDADRDAT